MLLEVMKQGWQAVPAMTANEKLWLSRYGKGINSFLVISNPSRETIQTKIKIDNSYLGEGNYLFSTYDGETVDCKMSKNRTFITTDLSPHEAKVYRALVEIEGEPLEGNGKVCYDPFPLEQGKLIATITTSGNSGSRNVCCNLPVGAHVKNIYFNNREVKEWSQKKNKVKFSVNLKSRNRLEIVYSPQVILKNKPKEFQNFPFIANEKPNCVIITDKENYVSAQRISAYFEYWYLCQKYPTGSIMHFKGEGPKIPIYEGNTIPENTKNIILVGSPKKNNLLSHFITSLPAESAIIHLQEERGKKFLLVVGSDKVSTQKAVVRLLGILDEKYPFYGAVTNKPIFRKAKIAGKPLE